MAVGFVELIGSGGGEQRMGIALDMSANGQRITAHQPAGRVQYVNVARFLAAFWVEGALYP